jgi:hypothetical protein
MKSAKDETMDSEAKQQYVKATQSEVLRRCAVAHAAWTAYSNADTEEDEQNAWRECMCAEDRLRRAEKELERMGEEARVAKSVSDVLASKEEEEAVK